jgi:hypothetical protein
LRAAPGNQDSQCGARKTEQAAFDQQLPDKLRALCAHGQTDGDLPITGGAAGQQQIRDVGASDEQH